MGLPASPFVTGSLAIITTTVLVLAATLPNGCAADTGTIDTVLNSTTLNTCARINSFTHTIDTALASSTLNTCTRVYRLTCTVDTALTINALNTCTWV